MNDYLQSIIDRDPAARSKLSVILTYPGVKAVFFHRIANFFATAKFGEPPRTGSVILSGIGRVFSLNPSTGRTTKKCRK